MPAGLNGGGLALVLLPLARASDPVGSTGVCVNCETLSDSGELSLFVDVAQLRTQLITSTVTLGECSCDNSPRSVPWPSYRLRATTASTRQSSCLSRCLLEVAAVDCSRPRDSVLLVAPRSRVAVSRLHSRDTGYTVMRTCPAVLVCGYSLLLLHATLYGRRGVSQAPQLAGKGSQRSTTPS